MVEHVKIPNLDGLTELANRDGVDIKPTLLRVMTDLYVQKPVHTVEEERHYTELALRLIDQVDAATRAIVANRLASYPGAPRTIVAAPRARPHPSWRGRTGSNAAAAGTRRQSKNRTWKHRRCAGRPQRWPSSASCS